jgi:mRNA-degrading endonuclease YafQ of YafQ-DinJ toxin-antitoxin module
MGGTLRDNTMASSTLSTLQTQAGIPPGGNKSHSAELSDQYKKLNESKIATSKVEAEIRRLHRLQAASKGLKYASIEIMDLVIIFEDLLLNKSPVSKAFDKHEINARKCEEWAKRTKRYSVDKKKLTQAINCLANKISAAQLQYNRMNNIPLNNRNNTSFLLMKKHDVLDITSIVNSISYAAAWKKTKSLLDIAQRLQDKNDQLAVKDQTIADQISEIDVLKKEQLRNKSKDWEEESIKLIRSGVSVTDIAKRLSKGRTTISTYLNKSEVKLLIIS